MKYLKNLFLAALIGVAFTAAPSHAAFSLTNLTKLSAGGDAGPQLFSYEETGATIATITAANYLVDSQGQPLEAGDFLFVTGSDGQGLYTVLTASTSVSTVQRFGGTNVLQVATTWDPGATVDGAGVTSSGITVTGAALGDFCEVAAPYDLVDQLVTCYVQATDTAEIRIQNESGTNTDNASGSWKVRIKK